MSREKPEVGDVWKTDFAKYIVIQATDNKALCLVSKFRLASFNNEYLLQNGKYLGKSKVNLEELFDVKD